MKTLFKLIVLITSLSILSACAALDIRRSVPESASTGIQKVGVISILGDKFNLTHIGTTIFNNQSSTLDVSNWKIDDTAIHYAVKHLESTGQYSPTSLGSNFSDADSMFAAAQKMGLDTLITIVPSGYDNAPHYAPGYGLHRRTFFGITKECVYALFVIQVFDVSTRKKHGWQWGFNSWNGVPCYGDEFGTPRAISSEWKEDISQFSEGELTLLRENLIAYLEENVPLALRNLKLGNN